MIKATPFQPGEPSLDQLQHHRQIKLLMHAWILREIGARQLEKRGRGTQPFLLQMHERPSELDQAFVKISFRSVPIRQPEFFQDIMRFIKLLPVEAIEVAEIVRAEFATLKGRDALGDFPALLAHAAILTAPVERPK